MNGYVIAKKSDLVDVADAIRAKSGGTEKLVFPDGFVKAVGGITGCGSSCGSSHRNVNKLLDLSGMSARVLLPE